MIQMKKRTKFIIAAVVILAVVTAAAFLLSQNRTGSYTGMEVVKSTDRQDSNTVKYTAYGDNVIKYSRDGASALKPDGTVIWNGSYDMKNPAIDVCGDYAAVGDIGGKEVYVYNGSDSGTPVETLLPILQIKVASQGVVAVLMEDTDSNIITLYNPYDSSNPVIYEVPTNVSTDGFPVNMAISPDGKKLATNYVNVNNGVIESRLTFYNFDEYGKNIVDHIVSGKEYGQELIARIDYVSNDTACVFTEHGFSVFKGTQIPEEKFTVTLEETIHSIVSADGYAVFVTDNESETEEGRYRVRTYSMNSDKPTMDEVIDFEYEKVTAKNEELIFMSGSECRILNKRGKEIFSYQFDSPVAYLFGLSDRSRYLLITDTALEEIKLIRE